MSGEAQVWWDDLRQEAEAPPEPPRPARAPVVVGALIAVIASGGLAWWLSAPAESEGARMVSMPAAAEAPRTPLAPGLADAEQVRRAYEQFTLVYASGGPEGLGRFSKSCEQSLRGDGRILDFCLAFDLFAASVGGAPGADVPGKAEARRLALARDALPPGASADQRLAEVRSLMRATIGVVATPEVQTEAPSVIPAKAAPRPRARPAPKAPPICIQANVADRLVCANPDLAAQDRRMKQAYERALAAGVDALLVDRGQAEWRGMRDAARERGELRELYARRIGELEALARHP